MVGQIIICCDLKISVLGSVTLVDRLDVNERLFHDSMQLGGGILIFHFLEYLGQILLGRVLSIFLFGIN